MIAAKARGAARFLRLLDLIQGRCRFLRLPLGVPPAGHGWRSYAMQTVGSTDADVTAAIITHAAWIGRSIIITARGQGSLELADDETKVWEMFLRFRTKIQMKRMRRKATGPRRSHGNKSVD
jgi:hypothetical protein